MPKPSLLTPLFRLRNALDYPLRRYFHWRRPGGYHIKNQAKDGLFASLDSASRKKAEDLASRLLREYCLADLYSHSQRRNYRENLYYLDLISTALNKSDFQLPDPLIAADIGVSHWFYVQALYACLAWHPGLDHRSPIAGQPVRERVVSLTGYENDPYRVYNDLFSRYDHALGHLNGLPDSVVFTPRAFEPHLGHFDLITMFFPFVFEKDHLGWGLPAPLFTPVQLIQNAWSSLKPGGWLLIVNQGEEEYQTEIDRLLLVKAIPTVAYRHLSQGLFKYPVERYILMARHG